MDELRAALRGPLLLPGDAGYDDARSIWNAMIDRRPALIARCLGVADVVAGVQLRARARARRCRSRAAVTTSRDSPSCDGGLMLDMSLMRGVWVDPRRRIARAQAGCLLGDVDRETQLHGLAAVLGFVSQHGHRRPHAGRRLRLPDAPLRLDQRQRPLDGGGDRGRAHRARERDARTPTCSGACAAAAATSAS